MVLEPQGFVARIAEDLERTISQGRLPKDGSLPSEQLLAKSYGVSRSTVREALKQLAARGVVVQHPGRRNRAARLDVAITLENLSVALHAVGPAHPERVRLLEGYLSLKRETAVDLLAACCEHASQKDLDSLIDACFALAEGTRWEPQAQRWAQREFDLLRLAACVTARPGQFLLVQSLEKSFSGMAGKLAPHLAAQATYQWAMCAFHALTERDAQTIRRELPGLLKAGDEQLLSDTTGALVSSEFPRAEEQGQPRPAVRNESPILEPLQVGVETAGPDAGGRPDWLDAETASCPAVPDASAASTGEERSAQEHASSEQPMAFGTAPPHGTMPEPAVATGGLPGSVCLSRSACPTGSRQPRPTGGAERARAGRDGPCCCPQAPEGSCSVEEAIDGTWPCPLHGEPPAPGRN
jgi:GntR family transcriptional repressor for pyruvate dehydrogenase complex